MLLFPDALEFIYFRRLRNPEIGSPGIAAEYLHRIRFHFHYVFRRFGQSSGDRHMRSYYQHVFPPYPLYSCWVFILFYLIP